MRNLKRKSTELDENSHPDAEAVKCFIRSVLLTSKDGVLSSELQDEYMQLVGEPVPFKKLKFNSLDDFIYSIPDVVERKWVRGKLHYTAVADEKTQHIKNMVAKQKPKRPKPIKRKMDPTPVVTTNKKTVRKSEQSDNLIPQKGLKSSSTVTVKTEPLSNVKPKLGDTFGESCEGNVNSKVKTEPVSNVTVMNTEVHCESRPATKMANKATKTVSQTASLSSVDESEVGPMSSESTNWDPLKEKESQIPIDLKPSIRAVLETSKTGIRSNKLQGVFKRLVGIDIPYNLLGYNSLYSFMDTIPDVAMIESRSQVSVYRTIGPLVVLLALIFSTSKRNRKTFYVAVPQNPVVRKHEPLAKLKETQKPLTRLNEKHFSQKATTKMSLPNNKPMTPQNESNVSQKMSVTKHQPLTEQNENEIPKKMVVPNHKPLMGQNKNNVSQKATMVKNKPSAVVKENNKPQTKARNKHKYMAEGKENDKPQKISAKNPQTRTQQIVNNIIQKTINKHKLLGEVKENRSQEKTSLNHPQPLNIGHEDYPRRDACTMPNEHADNQRGYMGAMPNSNTLMNLREKLCSCCQDVFDKFGFSDRYAQGGSRQPYNGENDMYRYEEQYNQTREYNQRFAHGDLHRPPYYNVENDRYRNAEGYNQMVGQGEILQPPQYIEYNNIYRYSDNYQRFAQGDSQQPYQYKMDEEIIAYEKEFNKRLAICYRAFYELLNEYQDEYNRHMTQLSRSANYTHAYYNDSAYY